MDGEDLRSFYKRKYVIHSSFVKHDHAANRRAADTAQGGQPQNRTSLVTNKFSVDEL